MENSLTAGFWLSPQQKLIWTLQQNGRSRRAVCMLEVGAELAGIDWLAALRTLGERHEILRTVYVRQPGMVYPFQAVLDAAEPRFQEVDFSGFTATEQKEKLEVLGKDEEMASGVPEQPPVLRANLVQLAEGRQVLILSVPGMAVDVGSLEVLARDLLQIAQGTAVESGEEPLRYVQFAQWQNDLLDGDDEHAVQGRDALKNLATTLPEVVLPHELKPAGGYDPQVIERDLDSVTAESVDGLAARLKVSSREVLLAAWQAVLWRLAGLPKFRTGVLFDFREYSELCDLVGPIAKIIPIEGRFDGEFRFREVVDHVHSAIVKATEWQEFYAPSFGFDAAPLVGFEYRAGSILLQIAAGIDTPKLKLCVARNKAGAALEFQYDGARLMAKTVEDIAGYFTRLLATVLANPEALIRLVPVLDEAESERLLVIWNDTAAPYPREKCYHQLFEEQAEATPERGAVRFGSTLLTYRELNEQTNQLAHHLREMGVGPDSLVGLCVERSAAMMVAVLAILKAGGAYVPINPDNPKQRTAQQLVGINALITEQDLIANLPAFSGTTLCLDRDGSVWGGQPRCNPEHLTTPENLAYVIYTSGSTGVPKGVAVRHRNLVNYSCFIAERLQLAEHSDGLQFATVSTIGADLGNTCIYPALISGGCLHVISYDASTDAHRLASYMAEYPVDVLKIVPSHLQALLDSPVAAGVLPRKYLILGGETFTPGLAEKIDSLGGTCEVFNHYGPTETTVGSLTLRLSEFDWRNSPAATIPIGRPIANARIYILDSLLQPVPTGVVGELYIAGDGVAAGYLNQPERTSERFITNPFSSDGLGRMYRTGDLARYLPDGNVEFLGRADDQIKIRGFRIELGEIESVLAARPGVKRAVVLAKEDARGDKRLVAYVAVDPAVPATNEALRLHLQERLPEFMVPSAIVPVTKIPLTTNGKIDRQALPEAEDVEQRAYVAPKTPIEEGIANIWETVLRREEIGTDENFFLLGGHSLLATQVVSRVRERFRVELPIRAMFDHPTITGLAKAVDLATETTPMASATPITRVSREAYRTQKS